MIPRVKISKVDGQTGVVKPGVEGILAIIAPSQKGTANQAQAYTSPSAMLADFGYGSLVEAGAYVQDVAGNPVVLVRGTASTPGAIGAITTAGAGTSAITADAGAAPLDDYPSVTVTFPKGGTIGVAGITYTYSLDGVTTSAVQALGTSTSITIPNTGIVLDLGVGTILDGETATFSVTGPQMTSADLTTALEALRVYGGAWEGVLVLNCDATASIVGSLDTWLAGLEGVGKARFFAANVVRRTSGQTEAAYATALTTSTASMASIRGSVFADGGDLTSVITGIVQPRPTSLFICARAMASAISVDPAQVSDGPLSDCQIADDRGNPKYHNEELYPGLDDLRLGTLRTFNGRAGVFCNNAPLISSPGSDYVYLQHARVANKAFETAYQTLTGLLSKGVAKDPSTGKILEGQAQQIEELVRDNLGGAMKGHVSGVDFILHRDDDLSSNAGAKLTGDVEINALAYVKEFDVNQKFVRKLTRTVSVG